jgi:MFS family permease
VSALLSLGWFGAQLGRQLLAPLLPVIVEDLAITVSQAGVALTGMWGLYAVFHYPGGWLSDRLSRNTIVVTSLLILVSGFTALAVLSTLPGFLVGVGLIGIGSGLCVVSTRAYLSDLYPERRGLALGINQAAGMIGSALAAGISVAALYLTNWQYAFFPVAALLVVVVSVLHRTSDQSYVVARVDADLRGTLARLFRLPQFRSLLLAYALYMIVTQGAMSFLPAFLQFEKGVSHELAAAGFALMFIVGILVMPFIGNVSDGRRRLPVAVGSLVVCVGGLIGVLVTSNILVLFASLIVFSGGLWSFPAVMQAYLLDIFPTANAGGDFGAARAVIMALGSVGPAYVGIVAEIANYTTAFGGFIVCLLGSVGILSWSMPSS